jgi:crossover junction endodeoxyribonuclease RuvC
MKILGIDPGYERLGIAVVAKDGSNKETVVFSTCVRTSPKLELPDRLLEIGNALRSIIKEYAPDAVAIEALYFAKNTTTALKVAEARGVIQYVTREAGIAIMEYHPNAIKIAVTGYGAAKKEDIAIMVPKLVQFQNPSQAVKIDDELDAIAVALTHIAHARPNYPQLRS